MAIRIRIEDGAPVRFALAPLAEALLSLHALRFPKRHPVQHVWIRSLRAISPRGGGSALLLGLTDSGTSKQVRRLVDAGLVRQRREGRYVLHELDRERLAALGGELLAFLGDEG